MTGGGVVSHWAEIREDRRCPSLQAWLMSRCGSNRIQDCLITAKAHLRAGGGSIEDAELKKGLGNLDDLILLTFDPLALLSRGKLHIDFDV
jgi:hypothetical protein